MSVIWAGGINRAADAPWWPSSPNLRLEVQRRYCEFPMRGTSGGSARVPRLGTRSSLNAVHNPWLPRGMESTPPDIPVGSPDLELPHQGAVGFPRCDTNPPAPKGLTGRGIAALVASAGTWAVGGGERLSGERAGIAPDPYAELWSHGLEGVNRDGSEYNGNRVAPCWRTVTTRSDVGVTGKGAQGFGRWPAARHQHAEEEDRSHPREADHSTSAHANHPQVGWSGLISTAVA